jgi:hypothetical protein
MNKLQRIAVLNLSLATAGLFLQLLRILTWDLSYIRLVISIISLIICCGLVASYVFRGKLAKQGAPHYDERDRFICKRALFVGLMTLFFVVFAASIISFVAVGPGGAIDIAILFAILTLGTMSLFFAESVAILVQYGWEGGNDE